MTAVGKARDMGPSINQLSPAVKGEFLRRPQHPGEKLDVKKERALVQARGAGFFAPDRSAEHSLDQIVLEAANDRVLIKQVQDRRMAFENLGAAFLFIADILRHETFLFSLGREPFGALRDGLAF